MSFVKKIVCLLLIFFCHTLWAQNKYGLQPTTFEGYVASVKIHAEKELIDLEKFIPSLVLDIRYATANNFTKEKIYTLAKAYARKPVAESLKKFRRT